MSGFKKEWVQLTNKRRKILIISSLGVILEFMGNFMKKPLILGMKLEENICRENMSHPKTRTAETFGGGVRHV